MMTSKKLYLVLLMRVGVLCMIVCEISCSNNNLVSPRQMSELEKEITLDMGSHKAVFDVEIADTKDKRERGLMWRRELPEHRGMLFIFEEQENQLFWMKNTSLSLDLIFIDNDFNVVGIIENAQPFSLTPLRIKENSRFVLEIGAGLAKKYGINLHSKLRFSYEPINDRKI